MADDTRGIYTEDRDFDELLDKCMRIMKTKAVDYAEEGDRLAEFRQTGSMVGVDMRAVLGVYLNKHLRSLYKWLRGDELRGEPIEEKLTDIIIYCLLAYKIAKEERATPPKVKIAQDVPEPPTPEEIEEMLARPATDEEIEKAKDNLKDLLQSLGHTRDSRGGTIGGVRLPRRGRRIKK